MPNRYYIRKFLNRPGHHGGAYVLASVEDTTKSSENGDSAFVEFELSDCFHRIGLDFPLGTRIERGNSLAKARLLAEVTARFLESLEAEIDLTEHRSRASSPRTPNRTLEARQGDA